MDIKKLIVNNAHRVDAVVGIYIVGVGLYNDSIMFTIFGAFFIVSAFIKPIKKLDAIAQRKSKERSKKKRYIF